MILKMSIFSDVKINSLNLKDDETFIDILKDILLLGVFNINLLNNGYEP